LGFFHLYNGGSQSFVLTTTELQPVNYSIYVPRERYHHSGQFTANNSKILNLPSNMETSSYYHVNYGIYLETSSDKVTVIGENYNSHTTDTYLALPTVKSKTITEHIYYGMSVYSPSYDSSILIVGTEDNTVIRLKATQSTTVATGSSYYYRSRIYSGRQYSFTINKLQTMHMETGSDLSGTKIVASKPVSVFGGHRCAYVPYSYGNCGYLIEQIPPISFWGTIYYAAPLATKNFYTLKVLAAYDSTNVMIYCNGTAQSYNLNEQGHVTKTLDNQEYCAIHSNKKVLVAQFSGKNGEDPSMTLLSHSNNFASKFQFPTFLHATNSYYSPNYVNIIVMAQYFQPDMIYLITGGLKSSLNTQEWTPFIVNNITEAYATKVTVLRGIVEIIHTNPAALMATVVYGVAARNGYIHPGGLSSTVGKYITDCFI